MKVQFEVNERFGVKRKVTIEASMDVLNDIEVMALNSRIASEENGYTYTAKMYDTWFNEIHDALKAKGYYDDIK